MTRLRVDGSDVDAPDDGSTPTLLDLLRDRLGIHSVKDGCSPQGQCGCCTVWVDGSPRVACVTPVRRLEGREVTTLDGLPEPVRARWAEALVATGGSQCGFCTPGIVMRLAALADPGGGPGAEAVDQALLAHLCRCTGWQTIVEAAGRVGDEGEAPAASRDLDAAAERARLEGGAPQRVGTEVVLGRASFADDTCPAGALVAVPDGSGGHALGETVAEARAAAGKVQGRRTSLAPGHPLAVPEGRWDLTLATTWVEPGYVEPDASWCVPGGEPAPPLGNGGAFGGKRHSPVGEEARRLADRHGRTVRVVWSREDVVRRGPKRPPVAGGIDRTGAGLLLVAVPEGGADPAAWERVVAVAGAVAPGLELRPVPVAGPPVSFDLRGAVWAEAAVLAVCARALAGGAEAPAHDVPLEVVAPDGGRAVARCRVDGSVGVHLWAGPVLDEVVLRSYAVGATHQALGLVRSEGIAVDGDGQVRDLTVRSFGILQARAMPRVEVALDRPAEGSSVNGSDAVLAAVAAARWLADGLPPHWPTDRAGAGRR